VSQLFELKVAKGDEVLHINAVVGEHNADVAGDEEDEIKVEKIIKHPAYNNTDAGSKTFFFIKDHSNKVKAELTTTSE
jgi:hypothetical protein